jgi:hypothetical protein
VELEHRAVGLAGDALREVAVDLLGDRVEALVLVVDVQPAERLPGRAAQLLEHREREPLAQLRVVLPDVVEDDRRQADERLPVV